MTRCQTTYVHCRQEPAARRRLAEDVDAAVARLVGDLEPVSVALAAITAEGPGGEGPTAGVLVTVLSREP